MGKNKMIYRKIPMIAVCLSLIASTSLLYGLFSYLFIHQKNSCKMTYMFEYPEYVKMNLKYDVVVKFSRYNLYIYGEGRYAQELRKGQLNGIPVLFIPGNAGSYRQARSIASIALRVGETNRSPFHFNIFAVDFREELSGLYGGPLNEQKDFVFECLQHIKNLYSQKHQIILIGHSMGGIVASAVISSPKFDTSNIALFYTLATPHKEPVVYFDKALVDFYRQINWKRVKGNTEKRNLPIVSVAGGERDVIVRSDLTFLEIENAPIINVFTSAIPGVWLSNDHLSITWCKQMMLTIVRSMFDLIENFNESWEIAQNSTTVENVLYHHFIQRSSGGLFPKIPFNPFFTLPLSGQWIYEDEPSWRFSKSKVFSTTFIMIPLIEDEHVVIIASGLGKADWILACKENNDSKEEKTCSEAINLSNQGRVIPERERSYKGFSSLSERKMIDVASSDMIKRGSSHLLILVFASNIEIEILAERYRTLDRQKHIVLPSIYERLAYYFSPVRIENFPLANRGVYYNFTFTGLASIMEASTFIFETRICRAGSNVGQGIVRLRYMWSNEEEFFLIKTSLGSLTHIPVKPHFLPRKGFDRLVQLQIVFDPECSYVLFLSSNLTNILSQFVKFYGLYVPGYAVAIYLSMLSGQLYSCGVKGWCPTLFQISLQFPTIVSLVILPWILYHGLIFAGLAPAIVPFPDNFFYNDTGVYSTLLIRALLYITGHGLVLTLAFIFAKTLVGLAYLWIWIRRQAIFQSTEVSLTETTAEKNFKVSFYNLLLCTFLQAVSVCMAGSVSLVIVCFIYFYKVLKMCVKSKADEERRGKSAASTKWHLQLLLAILWLLSTLFTIPAFITWSKQLPFTVHLTSEPYTFPCITLLFASTILFQLPVPVHSKFYHKFASYIILLLAILSTLYGIKSVYRIIYIISFAFMTLAIQQFVSFVMENPQEKVD